MSKPKITETDISKLTPDPNNARKRTPLSASVIRKSIEQFGMTRSIVLDENGVILAGNGAFEEAGQLGIERVIVVETTGNEIVAVKRTNLTAEQKTQYAIADNTASDFSTWDFDILSELTQEVDLSEFFPDDKLNELLEQLGKGESFGVSEQGEENEEEIAELLDKVDEIESRVKLGEIWALGRHRLGCGDSTIEGNVRALLGDRFGDVGMVWSDAPYGFGLMKEGSIGKIGNSREYVAIANDQDTKCAHSAFNTCRIFDCVQVWWGANYFTDVNLPSSKCWIVWDKDHHGMTFADAELAWTNIDKPTRCFRHAWSGNHRDSEQGVDRVHPNQKPVALCEWVFEKYGQPDDLIFDPFLGSGISIIAAQKMEGDRTVYGFELSPAYCEVILQRFEKLTGIEPKLIGRLPD
jgi:DNA methylase